MFSAPSKIIHRQTSASVSLDSIGAIEMLYYYETENKQIRVSLTIFDNLQIRDVKFVIFPNSNFVFKIRILFELRSGP